MWNQVRRSPFKNNPSVRIRVKYVIAPMFLAMALICTMAVFSVNAQTAPVPIASPVIVVAAVAEQEPGPPALPSTITEGATTRPATTTVISYDAVQIVRNGKPDPREFTLFPTQEHP